MTNTTAIVAGLILIGALFMVMATTVSAMDPMDPTDPLLDPDSDGLTNVEEFNAGSDPNNPDTDNDGLPDGWEVGYGLDPSDPSDALVDEDYSGGEEYADFTQVNGPHYTNYDEYYRQAGTYEDGSTRFIHTNPLNPNTDGDEYLDPDDPFPLNTGNDPNGHPTGPTVGEGDTPIEADDDGDSLSNEMEMEIGTDPNNPDTDGDGLTDDREIEFGTDPNDWDTDNDLLMDGNEIGIERQSTDGHFVDSDADGVIGNPTDPNDPNPGPPLPPNPDPLDPDHDGLTTPYEDMIGTDPYNPDTDGDGLRDNKEVEFGTDPNDWDTDNDLLMDGNEIGIERQSTDGHFVDSDADGI